MPNKVGRCLRPALAPLRGSARFAVFGLAAIAIAGCAPRASDTPVPTDIDDSVREIAAGDSLDARFARVILADGRVTVREVKTWLAESEAEAGR